MPSLRTSTRISSIAAVMKFREVKALTYQRELRLRADACAIVGSKTSTHYFLKNAASDMDGSTDQNLNKKTHSHTTLHATWSTKKQNTVQKHGKNY